MLCEHKNHMNNIDRFCNDQIEYKAIELLLTHEQSKWPQKLPILTQYSASH